MQGKKFIDVICYILLELRYEDAKVIKMILQEGNNSEDDDEGDFKSVSVQC